MAVWQPAVLGRKCTRPASRSTRLSASPARLMRRIEAVTISVPLAAIAVEHDLAVRIAGGAEEQPRAELAAGDGQRIRHLRSCSINQPPWRARTISTLSPGLQRRVAPGLRAAPPLPLSATATPRCVGVDRLVLEQRRDASRRRAARSSPLTRICADCSLCHVHRDDVRSLGRLRGANRSRPNGRMAASTSPSQTSRAIASAVTGVSRMPLR